MGHFLSIARFLLHRNLTCVLRSISYVIRTTASTRHSWNIASSRFKSTTSFVENKNNPMNTYSIYGYLLLRPILWTLLIALTPWGFWPNALSWRLFRALPLAFRTRRDISNVVRTVQGSHYGNLFKQRHLITMPTRWHCFKMHSLSIAAHVRKALGWAFSELQPDWPCSSTVIYYHEEISAFSVWTQCGLLSPQSLANFAEIRFRSATVPGWVLT
jgi:hypothetical protein